MFIKLVGAERLIVTLEFIFVTICRVIMSVLPWVSPKPDPAVYAYF